MKKEFLSDDDIFLYFEIISEIEPKSVLDLGAFLQAVGSVSRSAKGLSVPAETRLDTFTDTILLPVFNRIYNHIYHKTSELNVKYELTISIKNKLSREQIQWILHNSKYILVDYFTWNKLDEFKDNVKTLEIFSGESKYMLIFTQEY